LIIDALGLGDGAIFETEYFNGEVVNQTWIMHHFEYNTFRIFAFLDDFAIPTAHPGGGPGARLKEFSRDIQQPFYSGYLQAYGPKAQVVFLPISITGSVFITELCQNDN
jgi:hypothetical protein